MSKYGTPSLAAARIERGRQRRAEKRARHAEIVSEETPEAARSRMRAAADGRRRRAERLARIRRSALRKKLRRISRDARKANRP